MLCGVNWCHMVQFPYTECFSHICLPSKSAKEQWNVDTFTLCSGNDSPFEVRHCLWGWKEDGMMWVQGSGASDWLYTQRVRDLFNWSAERGHVWRGSLSDKDRLLPPMGLESWTSRLSQWKEHFASSVASHYTKYIVNIAPHCCYTTFSEHIIWNPTSKVSQDQSPQLPWESEVRYGKTLTTPHAARSL